MGDGVEDKVKEKVVLSFDRFAQDGFELFGGDTAGIGDIDFVVETVEGQAIGVGK